MYPALQHLKNTTQNTHLSEIVTPIIASCIDYFRKTNDLIHDHQFGLYGLLDDAFYTMSMIYIVQETLSGIDLPFDKETLKKSK